MTIDSFSPSIFSFDASKLKHIARTAVLPLGNFEKKKEKTCALTFFIPFIPKQNPTTVKQVSGKQNKRNWTAKRFNSPLLLDNMPL